MRASPAALCCLAALSLPHVAAAQSLSGQNHARLESKLRGLAANLGRLNTEMARCGQTRQAHYRAEIISTVERFDIVDRAALVDFVDRESAIAPASMGRCSPALARVYLERHLLGLGELDAFLWASARE
jgi:hypothetical protein